MRTRVLLLTATIAFLLAGPSNGFSQTTNKDQVRLRSGNRLFGLIVEYKPNKHVKFLENNRELQTIRTRRILQIEKWDETGDSLIEVFSLLSFNPITSYRKKGYFFKAQVVADVWQMGLRVINGYKFGRFGYVGVGIGLEALVKSEAIENMAGLTQGYYSGGYVPVFLHYEGDVMKTRVTPFYALELGYNLSLSSPNDNYNSSEHQQKGGLMGGVGIGVKLRSGLRFNMSISPHIEFKHVTYDGYIWKLNPETETVYTPIYSEYIIIPGLRFSFGF